MATLKRTNVSRTNSKCTKIFAVEDNDDHWTLIQRAIQQVMPEADTIRASSQQEASAYLDDWAVQEWDMPNLVLLDLYIPERTGGLQLLEQVRAMPVPCKWVPVIVFSSSTVQDDILDLYEKGCSSYIVKPLDYGDWLLYFQHLRTYWWGTSTLPPTRMLI